jgi:hypothetical protein
MMALRSSCAFVIALLGVVGCSSTTAAPTGGTSSSASSSGSGGGGGSSGSSGSGGGFDAGATVTTLESGIGPLALEPGEEQTQCIVMNLKNPEGGFVRRLRAELNEGSHHVIIYRSSATEEDLVAKPCSPLGGIFSGDHPMMIAQQAKAELVFPTDESGTPVGLEIAPNQMVRLEMHYINTTSEKAEVGAKVLIDTVPLSTTVVTSDLAFWGTADIDVPANGTGDTGVKFQRALAGTKSFALTTHQHHFGTRMRVWYASDASDTGSEPVADSTSWSDPPLEILDPPLDFPTNGSAKLSTKGLAFRCEWKNTSPNDVKFGEGFNDEMCFLWHYYFPSRGFQSCMDGLCQKSK